MYDLRSIMNALEGNKKILWEGFKFSAFTALSFLLLKMATYIYTVSTVPEFADELDLLNANSDALNETKQGVLDEHPEIYGIHPKGSFDHIPEWVEYQKEWDEHMEWNSDFLQRVAEQSIFEFKNPLGWLVAAAVTAPGSRVRGALRSARS